MWKWRCVLHSILLRNKFKEEIPLESIKDMDIEDYVMGDGKSSGFCYDLEKGKWRYAGPGIGGQNVSKFGISKHDGKYVTDKHMDVIENPDEFWENFKNQLYSFLKEYETLEEAEKNYKSDVRKWTDENKGTMAYKLGYPFGFATIKGN